MNGKKAKRLRREAREQQAATLAKAPGEFEAMPVIPKEHVKSYLLTRFIGKSGYRFISISKPGAFYESEEGKDLSLVLLHRVFPAYNEEAGSYSGVSDDMPEACVRTSPDFESFVMDREAKCYTKGSPDPVEDYEPSGSLEKIDFNRLTKAFSAESRIIEDQQQEKMNTPEARLMMDEELHLVSQKYVADIMKQRFAAQGIVYYPDHLVDETGKTVTDPTELISIFSRACPKEEISKLGLAYCSILCKLYDKYRTHADAHDRTISYAMMDYLYELIRKEIIRKGYLVSADRITITKRPDELVRIDAAKQPGDDELDEKARDELILSVADEMDAWTRLTFINLYNDILNWYEAGLRNGEYTLNCNVELDDLKDYMDRKGMPYGTVDGHPCFVKDGRTLPYKEFVQIALEYFIDWQARLKERALNEAKETPLE